jgi:polysaccharide pyruvyl transferase WcaK-like protein
MSARRRHLFVLKYNNRNDNLGDQIIFRALTSALGQYGRTVTHGSVPSFAAGLRVESAGWRAHLVRAWTRARGGSIFQVLSPGAALWMPPAPPVPPPPTRPVRRFPPWLSGRPIALGRSVIPEADHSWCRDAAWVGVRDDESLRALRDAGYANATYFPDLAFLVQREPVATPASRSAIALSFRNRIPEDHHSSEYERHLTNAIEAILSSVDSADRSGAVGFHQVEADAQFVETICQAHGLQCAPEMLTLSSYASFFAGAAIVLSNRLHCLLFGARYGAVPVALTMNRHSKVVSLFRTVGWNSLVLDVTDARCIERFQAIRRDAGSLRTLVSTTFERQQTLAKDILQQRFGSRNAGGRREWQTS